MWDQGSCERRQVVQEPVRADLVVVGGGMAGVCAAVTAARAGIRVALVQDRPVLGGNASSEVRMVVLGATASMSNNNRWAREGGVIDEILLENVFRNPQGNPVLSDVLLLEMVAAEPNVTLLLDTAVFDVVMSDADSIAGVVGYCAQNETLYRLEAPLFCDASGDGIVGFLAGAAFRMGSEAADEFGEPLAPKEASGDMLGHTIYFQSIDVGRPVPFVAPHFALKDMSRITRLDRIRPNVEGRQWWWLEYGGHLDTIHATETIKWELWRIVYGIWNYIKNSGKFPEAETLTLEWVGAVPGKRESRRFEGLYTLTQRDIVERRPHDDAVSYGGWSIDLHPVGGLYSSEPPCSQWHSKGIYPIPYRTLVSRNIRNLFLAGRNTSASHVAFGSTRVMATCAHGAQAVGMAAALCRRHDVRPAELAEHPWIERLQRELARAGQYIPGYRLEDPEDLAREATITASSRLVLSKLPSDGEMLRLTSSRAMLLPAAAGRFPRVSLELDATQATSLTVELRAAAMPGLYTPEMTLASRRVELPAGGREVEVDFGVTIDTPRYVFVCLLANPLVSVRCSRALVSGVTLVTHAGRSDVTSGDTQNPPAGSGIDAFEFWRPLPLAEGRLLAVGLGPGLDVFGPENVANGFARPTCGPNAWVADPKDARPTLTLSWPSPRRIGRVVVTFDTDRDNPLFWVLHEHPERVMPQCVRAYRLIETHGLTAMIRDDNHHTRNIIRYTEPVVTDRLDVRVEHPSADVPATLVEVRCYRS